MTTELKIIDEMIDDKNYEMAISTLNKMIQGDDISLNYICTLRIAEIYMHNLNDFDKAIQWLMKSYSTFDRIEGLIILVKYYLHMNRLTLAYALCLVCLFTEMYQDIGCDEFIYKYERFFVLSQICMKMKRYDEANSHIKKAIEYLKEDQEDYDKCINDCREIFEESALNMK